MSVLLRDMRSSFDLRACASVESTRFMPNANEVFSMQTMPKDKKPNVNLFVGPY